MELPRGGNFHVWIQFQSGWLKSELYLHHLWRWSKIFLYSFFFCFRLDNRGFARGRFDQARGQNFSTRSCRSVLSPSHLVSMSGFVRNVRSLWISDSQRAVEWKEPERDLIKFPALAGSWLSPRGQLKVHSIWPYGLTHKAALLHHTPRDICLSV